MARLEAFCALLSAFVTAGQLKHTVLIAGGCFVYEAAFNRGFMTTIKFEASNHSVATRKRFPAVVRTSHGNNMATFGSHSTDLELASAAWFATCILAWVVAVGMSLVAPFLAFHVARSVELGGMATDWSVFGYQWEWHQKTYISLQVWPQARTSPQIASQSGISSKSAGRLTS